MTPTVRREEAAKSLRASHLTGGIMSGSFFSLFFFSFSFSFVFYVCIRYFCYWPAVYGDDVYVYHPPLFFLLFSLLVSLKIPTDLPL